MLEIILKNREDCLLKFYRDKHATCKGIRTSMYVLGKEGGKRGEKKERRKKMEKMLHINGDQWLERITAVVFLYILMLTKAFR